MNTKYFKNITTIEELKQQYKKLCFKYHPDRPNGSTEIMQQINAEYEQLCEILPYADAKKNKNTADKEDLKNFMEIINKIINLDDIEIDLVGEWIWVRGNTYKHKTYLKEVGFLWASKKKMWYYKPADYVKVHYKKNISYEEIKNKYGCKTVSKTQNNKKCITA